MENVANGAEVMAPLADPGVVAPVTRLSAKSCEELRSQFESVAEFADLCVFLTAGRSCDRASELVDVAEALLAEAMTALGPTAA